MEKWVEIVCSDVFFRSGRTRGNQLPHLTSKMGQKGSSCETGRVDAFCRFVLLSVRFHQKIYIFRAQFVQKQ